MRAPLESVFFDVGGTLLEVSPSVGHVYAAACRERGASVEPLPLQRAFDEAWVALSRLVPPGADRYSHLPGGEEMWWERVSSLAFDRCGVLQEHRPPAAALRGVFARAEAWRVFPDTHAILGTLRGMGIPLGVISNWDSRLPALLRALGLDDYFDCVVTSAAVRCEKPHPGIFRQALDALGVAPAGAVHIGDRLEEDYTGARAAGLRALLVDRAPGRPGLREEVQACGDADDLVLDLQDALRRIAG
jgi:putative hydrolase of the HAD superfamily